MKKFRWLAVPLVTLGLAACGGGGGAPGTQMLGTGAGAGSGTTASTAMATAMSFVSSDQTQIYIKDAGALDQAVLTFKVVSAGATAVPGAEVKFSIESNSYGHTLLNSSATSSAEGLVSVTVKSGALPGPIKVRAELVTNSAVFALSQDITVATSPPSQKFMSVTAEKYAIEGWGTDGIETSISVRIADQQGNPVQDGTVVNFTAEGGQVGRSCTTKIENGISLCSVVFASQEYRPPDGRVSILAYLEGINAFVDNNSNNVFDSGDILEDMGDAFRDDDENGVYQAPEFLIPRGGTGACANNRSSLPDGWPYYPSRSGTCDGTIKTTVRQQIVILLASSGALISSVDQDASNGLEFAVASLDHTALPMPAGTMVAVAAVDGTPGNGIGCTVQGVVPDKIPNNAVLPTNHTAFLKDCDVGDRINVTVTSPNGRITKTFIDVPNASH